MIKTISVLKNNLEKPFQSLEEKIVARKENIIFQLQAVLRA